MPYLISGRVQGVFFRENTKRKAKELDIFGWARNLPNGRVETVFEGEKENIEKIVEWTKIGPNWANVSDIEIIWEDYELPRPFGAGHPFRQVLLAAFDPYPKRQGILAAKIKKNLKISRLDTTKNL